MPEYRTARFDDVLDLAPRLRQADRDEIEAATGLDDPEKALSLSFTLSTQCWVVTHDGVVHGMFGAGQDPNEDRHGIVWAMTSDELVTDHRVWFIRNSPRLLDMQHERYPFLWNWIDARNELHIRWLEWLGFKFGEARNHGPKSLPFILFWRTA